MTRDFSVIIERDAEGYYVGTVPALRGCHSQARSLDELMDRIREAIEVCLEAQGGSLEPLDLSAYRQSAWRHDSTPEPHREEHHYSLQCRL